MVAEIGLIVAVYVVFRGIQAIVSTSPGGSEGNLRPIGKAVIVVFAIGMIIVTVWLGIDVLKGASTADHLAPPMPY